MARTFRRQSEQSVEPLIGTRVQVSVHTAWRISPDALAERVVEHMAALEDVFSVFRPGSELSQWVAGHTPEPSPQLRRVIDRATYWQQRSGGALNMRSQLLTQLWTKAQADGALPDEADVAAVVREILEPVDPHGGQPVNLNSLAKGFIVDEAVQFACVEGASRVVVNAGGDLVHAGEGELRVGIEDPHKPFDNAKPMTQTVLVNQALATSSGSRRYFTIDGVQYPHVFDPRSGRPISRVAQATIVAPTAMDADALATIATIVDPGEFLTLLDEVAETGSTATPPYRALLILPGGEQVRSKAWVDT